MKYFTDEKDLKKQYREWVKKLHPDHGGDENQFKEMSAEYEEIQIKGFKKEAAANDIVLSPEALQALRKIIHLEMLEIELIGSWLWVSGNTFEFKETLKAACFKWNSKRKKWFFSENKSFGYYKGDFEELKQHHGSQKIKTQSVAKLA